jgi:hypothetical protein
MPRFSSLVPGPISKQRLALQALLDLRCSAVVYQRMSWLTVSFGVFAGATAEQLATRRGDAA